MKRNLIYAVLGIFSLGMISCGGNNLPKKLKNPLELRPTKTSLVVESSYFTEEILNNSIAKYIEIVDEPYTLEAIDGYTYRIDIKAKSLQKANKEDLFENIDYTILYLVDDVGSRIGIMDYSLKNLDILKDFLYSGEGECLLRFEGYIRDIENLVKTPELIKGFIVKSTAYNKTAADAGTTVSETTVPTSGGDKWDNLISSYESYMKQYFKLVKNEYTKQSEIDALVEKSSAVKNQLNDAQDDLSQAQWVRFVDLDKKWEKDLEAFINSD